MVPKECHLYRNRIGSKSKTTTTPVARAKSSRHLLNPEERKGSQAWRLQLQEKFGGAIREDEESQKASSRDKAITIDKFGTTIDPNVLRDLELVQNGEDDGSEADNEISIEEIFNIDAAQIDSLSQEDSILDAGWDVEDLDDDEDEGEITNEDEDGWEVTNPLLVANPKLSDSGQSRSIQKDDIQERWKRSPALQNLSKDVLKKLQEYQEEADELEKEVKRKQKGIGLQDKKTHRRLRVISGSLAGRKLLSGTGELTRPMMEKVRAAAFDMLLSQCGSMLSLPQDSKWLDLFAGTGSVGIEAISRGAETCHFIELDKWVVDEVLKPNLNSCHLSQQTSIFTMRAEDYLKRASEAPEYATSFDFVSVCPPYLKVSYPELFGFLGDSPLVHKDSYILVEYPRKEKPNIPERIGPLAQLKDRKFGRTYLAIYGPELN